MRPMEGTPPESDDQQVTINIDDQNRRTRSIIKGEMDCITGILIHKEKWNKETI